VVHFQRCQHTHQRSVEPLAGEELTFLDLIHKLADICAKGDKLCLLAFDCPADAKLRVPPPEPIPSHHEV
jgi:hypothetical protein